MTLSPGRTAPLVTTRALTPRSRSWFTRGFDPFLVYGAEGAVYESPEPVWDERRVERVR